MSSPDFLENGGLTTADEETEGAATRPDALQDDSVERPREAAWTALERDRRLAAEAPKRWRASIMPHKVAEDRERFEAKVREFESLMSQNPAGSVGGILDEHFSPHERRLLVPVRRSQDAVLWRIQRRNRVFYANLLRSARFDAWRGHPDTAFKLALTYFGLPVAPLGLGLAREYGPMDDPDDDEGNGNDDLAKIEPLDVPLRILNCYDHRNFGWDGPRNPNPVWEAFYAPTFIHTRGPRQPSNGLGYSYPFKLRGGGPDDDDFVDDGVMDYDEDHLGLEPEAREEAPSFRPTEDQIRTGKGVLGRTKKAVLRQIETVPDQTEAGKTKKVSFAPSATKTPHSWQNPQERSMRLSEYAYAHPLHLRAGGEYAVPINGPPVEALLDTGGASVARLSLGLLTPSEQRRLQLDYYHLRNVALDRAQVCPYPGCYEAFPVNTPARLVAHIGTAHGAPARRRDDDDELLAAATEPLRKKLDRLQAEVSRLVTGDDQLQAEVSRLVTENDQHQAEVSRLVTKNDQLQMVNSRLQTLNSLIQTENDRVRTENGLLSAMARGRTKERTPSPPKTTVTTPDLPESDPAMLPADLLALATNPASQRARPAKRSRAKQTGAARHLSGPDKLVGFEDTEAASEQGRPVKRRRRVGRRSAGGEKDGAWHPTTADGDESEPGMDEDGEHQLETFFVEDERGRVTKHRRRRRIMGEKDRPWRPTTADGDESESEEGEDGEQRFETLLVRDEQGRVTRHRRRRRILGEKDWAWHPTVGDGGESESEEGEDGRHQFETFFVEDERGRVTKHRRRRRITGEKDRPWNPRHDRDDEPESSGSDIVALAETAPGTGREGTPELLAENAAGGLPVDQISTPAIATAIDLIPAGKSAEPGRQSAAPGPIALKAAAPKLPKTAAAIPAAPAGAPTTSGGGSSNSARPRKKTATTTTAPTPLAPARRKRPAAAETEGVAMTPATKRLRSIATPTSAPALKKVRFQEQAAARTAKVAGPEKKFETPRQTPKKAAKTVEATAGATPLRRSARKPHPLV